MRGRISAESEEDKETRRKEGRGKMEEGRRVREEAGKRKASKRRLHCKKGQ